MLQLASTHFDGPKSPSSNRFHAGLVAARPAWLLAAVCMMACQHAPEVDPAPANSKPTAVQAQNPAPNGGSDPQRAAQDTTPAVEPPLPQAIESETIELDMLAHLDRAEFRDHGEVVVDFGNRAARKYDAAGWLSGTRGLASVAGEDATAVRGKKARLWLPSDDTGAKVLELRVRSGRATPLTVYVNGKTIGHAKLHGKGFEQVTASIPASLLHVGDNEVQLRVQRTGVIPGIGSAGLAISAMRLNRTMPKTPLIKAALPRRHVNEEHVENDNNAPLVSNATLHIGAGMSAGFGITPSATSVLRMTLRPADRGKLTLEAHIDGQNTHVLAQITATSNSQQVSLPLGNLAGKFIEVRLQANEGDLMLEVPRVVSLRKTVDPDTSSKPQVESKPKNVLIVLIDTLRADKLETYNSKSRVKTPGLQLFLRNAAVMLNARTQENWTKPSVATLLSSLLPWEHNAVTGEARVPRSVELLPELLKARGYHTAAFIANGYVSDKFGFKQGLDVYRNYIREGRKAKAQFVAADVLNFLDARPKDKPFFLYMHTIDPHVPYKPPGSFVRQYDSAPYSGPVDFRRSSTLLEKVKMGSLKLNGRDKRRLEALYDAEISYHDVHFAAVLRGLEERGLDKDTVVVVTADHGEEFWDHGSVGHGHSVYDELLHVPMVLRIPGLTHGELKLDDAVGLVDVMPTVLEAIGQPVPDHLSGTSFLPSLQGRASTAPRLSVSGFMNGYRTISSAHLKLIQRTRRKTTLYDTQIDPHENRDLAPSHPIALRHMRGLLGLGLGRGTIKTGSRHKKRTRIQRENVEIDGTTKAQLEALGYVGGKPR